MSIRPVIIDNYDSFTYNLKALVYEGCGINPEILKNDDPRCMHLEDYSHIVISPGPGLPHSSGLLNECLASYYGKRPIFGVCLGLQALAEYNGLSLYQLNKVCHGLRSKIYITNDSGIFNGLPSRCIHVGRYHSWAVKDSGNHLNLITTSTDAQGIPMSMEDIKNKAYGLQFHPESYMTEYGVEMMRNFLKT